MFIYLCIVHDCFIMAEQELLQPFLSAMMIKPHVPAKQGLIHANHIFKLTYHSFKPYKFELNHIKSDNSITKTYFKNSFSSINPGAAQKSP